VVILASDHGEGLEDHGEPTHGPCCYGTTIDAVLAVRAPGFGRCAEDGGLRSIADIAPTLRRLCNLPQVDADGTDLGEPPHVGRHSGPRRNHLSDRRRDVGPIRRAGRYGVHP